MNKQQKFNKICRDIKSIKIQGAENVAKAAFYAYNLIPNKSSKKKLISLRATEPMVHNVLNLTDKLSYKELLNLLKENKDKINKNVFRLIKNNSLIFTHCHSSGVINTLIYAKKHRKKFEVYNTETRPLFQGRKTANELKKAGIKVTLFVDSAADIAIKKSDMVLLGADAITTKGVLNKVGSGMFAEVAKDNHIPLYVISDSLKFSKQKIKIEQRNPKEIWNNRKISIKNPAFEFVPKENITKIITEKGIMSYNEFLKKVN